MKIWDVASLSCTSTTHAAVPPPSAPVEDIFGPLHAEAVGSSIRVVLYRPVFLRNIGLVQRPFTIARTVNVSDVKGDVVFLAVLGEILLPSPSPWRDAVFSAFSAMNDDGPSDAEKAKVEREKKEAAAAE